MSDYPENPNDDIIPEDLPTEGGENIPEDIEAEEIISSDPDDAAQPVPTAEFRPYTDNLEAVKNQLRGMYQSWFLDYASYVILERAVPNIEDGLKPVQRRILHSMKTLDDGRFNKVANIVGNTMQYHPHGDASINDALVQLGQKDLLVRTQGNWGNILTGASAAAGRYIEAKLSHFALDVLFNPKITQWTPTYDGRKKEPVTLPAKFPLLLAQGAEGIAVGLSSKILPHNFNEILDAAISYLRGEEFELYPDFVTGGLIDVSRYNDGARGGAVKVRAKIEKVDNKTLAITEIPFGQTTPTLIDSILKAQEKGKIKIRSVDDLTAEHARVVVNLLPGTSSDKTIDALYAFTACEASISPNCCVISGDKPLFLGVSDVLRHSVETTKNILKTELELRLSELSEQLQNASLERYFIEKRIYKDKAYEQAPDIEAAIEHINQRLQPIRKKLVRDITRDDILRLLEIRMKRILKFNSEENENLILRIKADINATKEHLDHLVDYTIDWYQELKNKYGENYPRHTVIRGFDSIEAANVAEANEKLYINREEGFIGTGLKKDEFIANCSTIDDVIIFYKDGRYKVVKVQEKLFIGKGVLYVNVFKRNDTRTIYNVIYQNGRGGFYYMKRFAVTGVTRDKEYNLTPGEPGTKINWFSANSNGEAEVVKVTLKPKQKIKQLQFDVDFAKLAIKGKQAMGNLVTKHEVHRFSLKEKGTSTLGGRQVWFDPDVLRINYAGQGDYLGEFMGDDRVLVIMTNGEYYTTTFEATNHFSDNILRIEKYEPQKVWTAILNDADQGYPYIKRFKLEPSVKPQRYLGENEKSSLILLTDTLGARFRLTFGKPDDFREPMEIDAWEFIGEKSSKARGKRLTTWALANVEEIEPSQIEEMPAAPEADLSDDNAEDGDTPDISDEDLRDQINGQQKLF
ncbi:MAG: DNA gyrase/topoisomerase IV subunit A [Bacteroidales bacterium]|nr:DNA gyrase/topoisomerase IV subunit A [Bacteroidales bacterium]